jgi:hypothetical protein
MSGSRCWSMPSVLGQHALDREVSALLGKTWRDVEARIRMRVNVIGHEEMVEAIRRDQISNLA